MDTESVFIIIFMILIIAADIVILARRRKIPRADRKYVAGRIFEEFPNVSFSFGKRYASRARKALFKTCLNPDCDERVYYWSPMIAAIYSIFGHNLYYCLKCDEFFTKEDYEYYKKQNYK